MSQRKKARPRRRKKRTSHERVIAPPDIIWLNKREAAGELNVSESFINRHLRSLGATKLGDLVRFHRARLTERALKLPTVK